MQHFLYPLNFRKRMGKLYHFPIHKTRHNAYCNGLLLYSFLIAAKGLNFIALTEGKYPDNIPTIIANTIAKIASQAGIKESFPSPPLVNPISTSLSPPPVKPLIIAEIP